MPDENEIAQIFRFLPEAGKGKVRRDGVGRTRVAARGTIVLARSISAIGGKVVDLNFWAQNNAPARPYQVGTEPAFIAILRPLPEQAGIKTQAS